MNRVVLVSGKCQCIGSNTHGRSVTINGVSSPDYLGYVWYLINGYFGDGQANGGWVRGDYLS